MKLLRFLALAVIILNSVFALANNPTPFVNQPLIPASVAPGGAGFTLTVNGTGFVSGSTVNWNGSPRTTTFVNASQLTATILSTDVVAASTASVTVVSPSPGGGASNVVFLPVRQPATFVSMNATSFPAPMETSSIASADLDKDGVLDMVIGLYGTGMEAIEVLLGNGDGTFRKGATYQLPYSGFNYLLADVNGDGNLDLLALDIVDNNNHQGLGVFLGNGDGTFLQPVVYGDGQCCQMVLGDFNHDGAIDIGIANGSACIFLGNGDGSFQSPVCSSASGNFDLLTVGDLNGDGQLDLALTGDDISGNPAIAIMLGNGDGTFRVGQVYDVSADVVGLAAADFNDDGRLDLAVVGANTNSVLIFLGNGDGSFQAPSNFPTQASPGFVSTGDMNGDGMLDLVVFDYGYGLLSVSILLGNGDGTFQPDQGYPGFRDSGLSIADFNNDGKLDVAVTDGAYSSIVLLMQDAGSALKLSADELKFPTQLVDTVSNPKLITVSHIGTETVTISKVTASGSFSELTNCRVLQPAKSCKIGIFFTPTVAGDINGFLSIYDDGGGSPQVVSLSGTATVVSFSPTKLDFGSLQVGKVSNPQSVLLTNEGNSNLSISEIGIGGADPNDFSEVNACPNKLPAGASCTITVFFHPRAQGARNAILGAKDGGGGSPQKVPLTGTGT